MKLTIIRYTKIIFLYLRLHKIFNLFSGFLANLLYLTKFSAWAAANRKVGYNDFPSKWSYDRRYDFYKWVIDHEQLSAQPVNYMEFGVAQGASFRWFLQQLPHPESRFYGFDTFTGLPEDWGPFKKGSFGNQNQPPAVDDPRAGFYQGLFQQTLPGFVPRLDNSRRNIIMMDADLYSATLYTLSMLAPLMKPGDIIFFDEFAVPTHEFKAFLDFTQAFYIRLDLIAAANNYYFTAFRVGNS